MTLNCRQGDIAIVVRGPDTGKVVTCVRFIPSGTRIDTLSAGSHNIAKPTAAADGWEVDANMSMFVLFEDGTADKLPSWLGRHAPDHILRPLRATDIDDLATTETKTNEATPA
jgi:hypothetical protein